MGQYRQWLQHREADQQLRAQLEQLEAEMMPLLEQASITANVSSLPSFAHNPLILALVASLDTLYPPDTPYPTNGSAPAAEQVPTALSPPSPQSAFFPISPALRARGQLPYFDSVEIEHGEKESPPYTDPHEGIPGSVPHPEMELLPEDMLMFFDEHTQTEPQVELPWWLRNLIESSLGGQGTRPDAQESRRRNRLVQRWSERWGQQPSTQSSTDDTDYKKFKQTDEGQEQ